MVIVINLLRKTNFSVTFYLRGPGGSMSKVVGLPNNSHKSITNTAWVRSRVCKSQKRVHSTRSASDKVYQLLAHGWWFSPGSSTTKTGRHDIAEIVLKAALNTTKSINQSIKPKFTIVEFSASVM